LTPSLNADNARYAIAIRAEALEMLKATPFKPRVAA
jgi:hypothetical protein